MFQAGVSSVILTTNSFGDFSKCTIVSEFMTHEKMRVVAVEAREVWQKFIHQPQTARCLVFVLLLGAICETITPEYEVAIEKLASIIRFNVSPTICMWIHTEI